MPSRTQNSQEWHARMMKLDDPNTRRAVTYVGRERNTHRIQTRRKTDAPPKTQRLNVNIRRSTGSETARNSNSTCQRKADGVVRLNAYPPVHVRSASLIILDLTPMGCGAQEARDTGSTASPTPTHTLPHPGELCLDDSLLTCGMQKYLVRHVGELCVRHVSVVVRVESLE